MIWAGCGGSVVMWAYFGMIIRARNVLSRSRITTELRWTAAVRERGSRVIWEDDKSALGPTGTT